MAFNISFNQKVNKEYCITQLLKKPNIFLDEKQIYTKFLLSPTTLAAEKQMFNV